MSKAHGDKLTKTVADAAEPHDRPYILYDAKLTGFGLRVMPSGSKSWIIEYRAGRGRRFPVRRMSLGNAGTVTAAQARTRAEGLLATARLGIDPLADRDNRRNTPTIKAVADAFLAEHVRQHRKPSTVALYERVLLGIVVPRLGLVTGTDLGRAEVAKLHRELRDRPVMANRVLAVLSSMFTWAAKAGLIPEGHNPTGRIERNRELGRERFLTPEELGRLGDALRRAEDEGVSPFATAAIRLLILTGCRLREILHLRWHQVDFGRGLARLADSKSGPRYVVLNAPALAVLNALPRVDGTDGLVITGGKPSKPRSDLKRPWATVCQFADLDGLRIHDLRHTFASVGVGAGMGLPIVGKLLGHVQSRTTAKYGHLGDDPLRKATDTIGATLAAAIGRPRAPEEPKEALVSGTPRKAG